MNINKNNIWPTLPTVLLKIICDYVTYPSLFEVVKQYEYGDWGEIISLIYNIRLPAGKNPIKENQINSEFAEFKLDLTEPVYFVIEYSYPYREKIIHISNKLPRNQDYESLKLRSVVCYLTRWNFLTSQMDGISSNERKQIWKIP